MVERVFPDGAVICRAGEPAEAVYRVRLGALEIEPATPSTDAAAGHAPVAGRVLMAGETFGVRALLAGAGYAATVRARGETVVEIASREMLLEALAARPEVAWPLIGAALELDQNGAPVEPDFITAAEPVAAKPAAPPFRLMPASPAMAEQIGAEGVPVETFPFVVGRRASGRESAVDGVTFVLRDTTPYNLSRRHFAIERGDGGYIVRDCDSFHGTIVNGEPIGAAAPSRVAALVPGENRIVAGKPGSPVCFTFTVG